MENINTNPDASMMNTNEDSRKKFRVTRSKCKRLILWACMAILLQLVIGALIASIGSYAFLAPQLIDMISNGGSMEEMIQLVLSGSNLTTLTTDQTMLINAVAYLVANPLAAFICLKASKIGKIRPMFKNNKFNALDAAAACIGTLGLTIFISILSNLFQSFFANSNQFVGNMISDSIGGSVWGTIVTILYVCILGPITEEILCRGAILRISSPVGRVCAIILSSVLFGYMHGNYTQMINAAILGLLLSYVAIKSESIVVPCIMHIVNNSISVIFSSVYKVLNLTDAQIQRVDLISNIVFAVFGLVAIIYLIKKYGKITKNDKVEVNEVVSETDVEEAKSIQKGFTLKVVFSCPLFWVVTAICNLMAIGIATGVLG